MPDGFKIAEAYVDIKAKMDGRAVKRVIENGLREADLNQAGRIAGSEISRGLNDTLRDSVKKTSIDMSSEFTDSGKRSSDGFIRGFGRIVDSIASVAKVGIKTFGDIFDIESPILSIALLTALIAALPAVGAAAAILIVGAFGAAFASIGLIAAAQNAGVKQSFTDTWNHIKDVLGGISKPFIHSMYDISAEMRRTFNSFAPHLATAFASMAPHISRFVELFGTGVRRLIPAIGPVTEAFNFLLDRIGSNMPALFTKISDTVIHLSNVLMENPKAVDMVFNALGNLVTILGSVVGWLTQAASWIMENETLIRGLFSAVTGLLGPMGFLASKITGVGDATDVLNPTVDRAIKAAQDAAFAFQQEALEAEKLSQNLDELAEKNLSADQAALRFDQSILKLIDSIKTNGTTLDTTTKAGVENKDALLSMADAANKSKDKYIEQGLSADEVRKKSISMRDEMVRQATQLGMTKDEAQKLIDKYFAIPEKEETQVSAPGATESKKKAEDVTVAVGRIPRSTTAGVHVDDRASGPLSNIIGIIGGIARQIWVNVTSIFSENGNILSFANGTEKHLAQIAPAGAMRVWAEPETGGEAYIPLADSKRPRSEAILANVADRFGLALTRPMADGGVIGSAQGANGNGGGLSIGSLNVNVSIAGVWDFTNPSRAREIATYIAPAIREAIRVDERMYA